MLQFHLCFTSSTYSVVGPLFCLFAPLFIAIISFKQIFFKVRSYIVLVISSGIRLK